MPHMPPHLPGDRVLAEDTGQGLPVAPTRFSEEARQDGRGRAAGLNQATPWGISHYKWFSDLGFITDLSPNPAVRLASWTAEP